MKNNKDGREELSATVLLQKIKSGEINPQNLSSEERLICVNVLAFSEGLKHTNIAQFLCCSERTITRDIKEINGRNSLKPNIELSEELVGKTVFKAEIHISHLMRAARSQEGSLGERVQAEFLAWKIWIELISKLQTLGYLPQATQRIEGDLFHHFNDPGEEKGFDDLKRALSVIETTAKEAGTLDSETENKIRFIKSKIEKAEIELNINNLSKQKDIEVEGGSHEEKQD